MGRWPWAGAGCAHGTPWEPRFDRDPDRRGDWETRWTTLRSLHGKCNPMEPLLDTIPNSNIGSTSYPDPPATSFAFLETWTVDDRCLMTPISYQDVNSCGSISWKSCSGIERIYEYTLREEKVVEDSRYVERFTREETSKRIFKFEWEIEFGNNIARKKETLSRMMDVS